MLCNICRLNLQEKQFVQVEDLSHISCSECSEDLNHLLPVTAMHLGVLFNEHVFMATKNLVCSGCQTSFNLITIECTEQEITLDLSTMKKEIEVT